MRNPAAGLLIVLSFGLLLLSLGGWLAMTRSSAPDMPTASRPNVVLIVVDAMRADRLGATRNGRPLTPFLDEFSKRAALYTHAVAQCSWTRPSMATLFTSLDFDTHQVCFDKDPNSTDKATGQALSENIETLAAFLKRHGYGTAAAQTNGNLLPKFGFAQGFDFYDYAPDAGAEIVSKMAFGAMDKLKAHKGQKFLYVHYFDPHVPYIPPDDFRKELGWPPDLPPEEMRIATDFMGYLWDYAEYVTGQKPAPEYAQLSEAGKDAVRLLYDAEILYADSQLRQLVSAIEKDWPNTMIIITADHGEQLWDHRFLGHGLTMYQEEVRVPLLISAPNLKPGRCEWPVGLIDLLPSIAEYAGLPAEPRWQGQSALVPSAPDRLLFSSTRGPGPNWNINSSMVIKGPMKLIFDRLRDKQTDIMELYDLGVDPEEKQNLAGTRPEEAAALRALIEQHREDGVKARKTAPKEVYIDPETQEQLRAVGYLPDKAASEPEKK